MKQNFYYSPGHVFEDRELVVDVIDDQNHGALGGLYGFFDNCSSVRHVDRNDDFVRLFAVHFGHQLHFAFVIDGEGVLRKIFQ